MKHIDSPAGCFCDRRLLEPNLEAIDVIMATLDAENFLEKSLYTIYREVPVKKLLVCDGGSKDATVDILKRFPRVELFVRPDIRTGAKIVEFLTFHVETRWFALIDGDIELSLGWYDEMSKFQNEFDVLENSREVLAYHKYKEDVEKLNPLGRSGTFCHLIKKSAMNDFRCEDDYLWRFTDMFLRQVVEKSGYRYGKINTTKHVHNETERIPYASDNEKNYQKLIIKDPEWIVLDKKKFRTKDTQHAKAFVKYLEPNSPAVKNNMGFDISIRLLKRKWVEENGPQWLERYDKANSLSFTVKLFLYRQVISKNKRILSLTRKFFH